MLIYYDDLTFCLKFRIVLAGNFNLGINNYKLINVLIHQSKSQLSFSDGAKNVEIVKHITTKKIFLEKVYNKINHDVERSDRKRCS